MAESIITNQVYTNFVSELKKMVSADRIYTDELRTLGWGTDASFYRMIPKVVVRSDTEQEVSQIVKLCSKHKLPFTFRAAGTSPAAARHCGLEGERDSEASWTRVSARPSINWLCNGGWHRYQQCLRNELRRSCQ